LLTGFLFSSLYVLFVYSYHRIEDAPEYERKMQDLRALWRTQRAPR
jgi:hypothetical protein